MKEKVVLAYSGGLDTSVSIKWLTDEGYDVIACCLDIGEGKDTAFIKEKALQVGAVASYAIDAKDEFANEYALIALQGHTFYEQSYPLVSALSRPLIAKKLVELARSTGATTVAHGCTGKGNDQVRFEVAINSLAPELKVIALSVSGNGPVKKKLPMRLKKVSQSPPIWIIPIPLIKIFGGAPVNAAF